ncbi:glycoside hydrolase family 127 protein [Gracilibacillus alcaliphilus]|uniref:glycoside hydrolase family 127 protein n=1 Tax=Gracilibacillus alcaliphilus TaxID=1401441 RepID=UPI00195BCD77|nr:beta-L-arabinofuranosidase domain-containing protein [Gracilibacillus alcaliphilus]MBM7675698.1 DUF1680 family protein [Gracilibacillus alcaliphilus]
MKAETKITSGFWETYQKVVNDNVIPYQWKVLNDQLEDIEPSRALRNFRIAAGVEDGEYYGMVFQDSDVYKWLESVAYSLRNYPDEELEACADEVIDLIGSAQLADGYVNTYYQVKEGLDKRWTNVRDNHELYCAGHMIEAAVAYYDTTKKTPFLEIAKKFADYIAEVFGPNDGQIKGYPGHEEIELALVRLYLVTNDKTYLDLATFFVEERGKKPNYFNVEAEAQGREPQSWWHGDHEYSQAHLPIREQKEAVGHAVRAVYFYSAVADLARLNQDETLKTAVKTLWENVVNKKMSINGGIGASPWGEAFAENYDLPNDTPYNETCASVGLAFWAKRMLALEPNGAYADVLENAVYNGSLCGMDLQGKRFLYVNPLQIDGAHACKRHDHKHVTPERQKWFTCACCPPNLARLIGSIGDYFVLNVADDIFINLYGDSETNLTWHDEAVTVTQETNYPWEGNIAITFNSARSVAGKIALRIPAWADNYTLTINGKERTANLQNGYLVIDRTWENNDQIILDLDMSLHQVFAHTNVTEDIGKAAVVRGPLVYVAEEVDNGGDLGTLWLTEAPLKEKVCDDLLPNAVYLTGEAKRLVSSENQTYSYQKPTFESTDITLIPYFMWGNREYGEIRVWLNAAI